MLQPVFDLSTPDGLAGRPRDGAADEARTSPSQMKWLVDEAVPEAEGIRVVLDNLNTHTPSCAGTRPSRRRKPDG
jgi:hypothetical protein